ncbi:MAG TPA: RNA 2',3'-cyclic phosphodiesterase [Myxococcota bacterium]|nr:RNA 2',3'-cyclic phosphodiesterase [Myxococcota bacterium]HRY91877.1 RNA 2',3'-cyclic phosphodiesterase [Myxococcota bacterium]HSA22220.1 RNA 2',3'-cyclic phosphodiesterase [Myxococcota bacterium]
MGARIRSFVAVHLSEEVRQSLGKLQDELRRPVERLAQVKWVPPGLMHLTLQFLGDVDEGLLPKLVDSLRGGFGDTPPFEVEMAGAGAFPSPGRPRVLWAGCRRGVDGLKALVSATCGVTGPLGFPAEDRPFKAHITLGRIKDGSRPGDLGPCLAGLAERELGRCQIERVYLMKSELRPSGPVYTVLDSFPLGR